jgi:hypothetical protein
LKLHNSLGFCRCKGIFYLFYFFLRGAAIGWPKLGFLFPRRRKDAVAKKSLKKLKPVATNVATGFCSPQNKTKLTPDSSGARIILNYF